VKRSPRQQTGFLGKAECQDPRRRGVSAEVRARNTSSERSPGDSAVPPPRMPVWLQRGTRVPGALVQPWPFCGARQAWFCQRSVQKGFTERKGKVAGCSRQGLVPRAALPGAAAVPWSPQPRGCLCQAILMQSASDPLVRAGDRRRAAVPRCRYAACSPQILG